MQKNSLEGKFNAGPYVERESAGLSKRRDRGEWQERDR